MPSQTVQRLRQTYDTFGQYEFEKVAAHIIFACAALILKVSGPNKLQDILDAIPSVISSPESNRLASTALTTISHVSQLLN